MLALFFFFRSHCRWICYFYFRRSIPCGTQCLLFVLYERRQRIYLWADFCFRHYLIPSRLSFNLDGVRVKCLHSFYRTRFVIDYISWTHLQLITVARVLFPCVSQFRSFKTRLWSEYWWMPAILSLSQANQLNRTETVKSAAMKCLFWLVDPVLLYFYVDNEIFSVSHIIRDLFLITRLFAFLLSARYIFIFQLKTVYAIIQLNFVSVCLIAIEIIGTQHDLLSPLHSKMFRTS